MHPIIDTDHDAYATSHFSEGSDSDSDVDSLFDEPQIDIAMRTAPPITGLFVPPVRLPPEMANDIVQQCMSLYFDGRDVNQIMLFGRTTSEHHGNTGSGLPAFLITLLHQLAELLRDHLPEPVHEMLFPPKDSPPRARQAILNLYHPGEGISPHVDLLKRFDDGIIGVSFGSGCVMSFERVKGQEKKPTGKEEEGGPLDKDRWDLYLEDRSVLVLSEDARYNWTHGINGRPKDFVVSEKGDGQEEPEWIERGTRMSITFRWLLPGADIVGGPDP
ncbi:hypothetical protein K503DRAFT_765944 [Rhizopogon vinicolor AM-OR11-026]|uniref:Fe2OG dioxygenase domain-containing protein n=1 Tax=Rhizopogon vinicolor AM-OR11-026 TaxID=1314800 RepID=A0A1B7NER9_9AGAM|nr:hypothetical protein K503DRAFT_765944 [Rhizopogon vinicolor AM-OR11-026]